MNWTTGASLEDEDSYGSSPPPSYSKGRGGAGAKAGGQRGGGADVYDFDISNDDDDGFLMKPSSNTSNTGLRGSFGDRGRGALGSSRENPTRRISLEERTKEIQRSMGGKLTTGRSAPLAVDSPEPSPKGGKGASGKGGGADWQRSYEDLMAGIADSPEPADSGSHNHEGMSPLSPTGGPGSPKGFKVDSAGESSYGDSLEISAADLEVGEYAKRRANEKTQDRKRRMAMDVAPHTLAAAAGGGKSSSNVPPKVAASPDLTNKMRPRGAPAVGGFQMSAALSSINNFSDDDDDDAAAAGAGVKAAGVPKGVAKGGMQRYGSVERSDTEIFKALGGRERQRESAGRGGAVSSSAKRDASSSGVHVSSLDSEEDSEDIGDEDEEDDEGSGDEEGSGDSNLARVSFLQIVWHSQLLSYL